MTEFVGLERKILDHARQDAMFVRGTLETRSVIMVNVMSAPGSGKTELLGAVADCLRAEGERSAVVVGDCATEYDAQRLVPHCDWVRQVVTDGVCHLEARMLFPYLDEIAEAAPSYLFVENVGNMVCPVDFDLGEDIRLVLLSTTEGEDKPAKYPALFYAADLVVMTKMDLADAAGFSLTTAMGHLRKVNTSVPVVLTSARTGVGIGQLLKELRVLSARRADVMHPSG